MNTREERIVVIVQNLQAEYLVFDHKPYKNPLCKIPEPHLSVGIWADVQELKPGQHAIAGLVNALEIEDIPRFLYTANHVARPEDRYPTPIGIYHFVCDPAPALQKNGTHPDWMSASQLELLLRNQELYAESQTAFTYFNVLGPQPRN